MSRVSLKPVLGCFLWAPFFRRAFTRGCGRDLREETLICLATMAIQYPGGEEAQWWLNNYKKLDLPSKYANQEFEAKEDIARYWYYRFCQDEKKDFLNLSLNAAPLNMWTLHDLKIDSNDDLFSCWNTSDTLLLELIADICKHGKLNLDDKKIYLRYTSRCRPYKNVPDYRLGEILHDMRHVLECKLLHLSLEHYKFVQQCAKESIDTWCMVARRLGVCKDVRRIISNEVWSTRDTWKLMAPVVLKHKQRKLTINACLFVVFTMFYWWFFSLFSNSWINWVNFCSMCTLAHVIFLYH